MVGPFKTASVFLMCFDLLHPCPSGHPALLSTLIPHVNNQCVPFCTFYIHIATYKHIYAYTYTHRYS